MVLSVFEEIFSITMESQLLFDFRKPSEDNLIVWIEFTQREERIESFLISSDLEVMVPPRAIPRTTSGKPRRGEARRRFG